MFHVLTGNKFTVLPRHSVCLLRPSACQSALVDDSKNTAFAAIIKGSTALGQFFKRDKRCRFEERFKHVFDLAVVTSAKNCSPH
jgi:hypothetical protein